MSEILNLITIILIYFVVYVVWCKVWKYLTTNSDPDAAIYGPDSPRQRYLEKLYKEGKIKFTSEDFENDPPRKNNDR